MLMFKIIFLLTGYAPAELVKLLEKLKALEPASASIIDKWLAALNGTISPVNLAAVGSAIPGELLNIAVGHLDPRNPPSGDI